MRIVFCDDLPADLEELQRSVQGFFALHDEVQPSYGFYSSGDELLAQETVVDIAFLDVEMHGSNGIHVAARLKAANPLAKIFIVTAHREYVDDAMQLQLFRYLSKPVDEGRLTRCLKAALTQYLSDTLELPLETKEGLVLVRSHRIVCVEGDEKAVTVQTVQAMYRPTNKLKDWKKLLGLPSFFETFRGILINLNYVAAFDRDSVLLRWDGGEKRVYLARRKYAELREKYLSYWGNAR